MTSIMHQTLQAIAAHPRGNDIARLALECLLLQPPNMPTPDAVQERAAAAGLSPDEAVVGRVRVFDELACTSVSAAAALVLSSLVAYALALDPPVEPAPTARKLIGLATFTGVDALPILDAAMEHEASSLWDAVAVMIRQHDHDGTGLCRAEAVVAASALALSENATAVRSCNHLASTCQTLVLQRLLSGSCTADGFEDKLEGELAPAPRGPTATFFLGLIGWLLLSHIVRLVARAALQYSRPAEVCVRQQTVHIRATTRLLGRVLRDSSSVLPLGGLRRVTREVRFPRAGTYAGLVALVVGSYVGIGWFLDGVRAASYSLATVGLLIVLGGVALDFALVSFLPGRKGKCRLVLSPTKGSATCVVGVDAAQADGLLRKIARRS